MMYLTRRPAGFRFQRRIPLHLQPFLGSNPIRLNLGHMTTAQAKMAARLLAGHVEGVFHGLWKTRVDLAVNEIRDIIISHLEDIVSGLCAELADGQEHHDLVVRTLERKSDVALKTAEARRLIELGGRAGDVKRDIERLGEGIFQLRQRAQSLAEEFKTTKGSRNRNADLSKLLSGFASLSTAVQTMLDGGPERPLMSVALETWHRVFQRFANVLVKVPANYVKFPQFRNLSQEQAAEKNRRLSADSR